MEEMQERDVYLEPTVSTPRGTSVQASKPGELEAHEDHLPTFVRLSCVFFDMRSRLTDLGFVIVVKGPGQHA